MFSAVVCLNLPLVAIASRGKVLVVMSGAHLLDLKEGKVYWNPYSDACHSPTRYPRSVAVRRGGEGGFTAVSGQRTASS